MSTAHALALRSVLRRLLFSQDGYFQSHNGTKNCTILSTHIYKNGIDCDYLLPIYKLPGAADQLATMLPDHYHTCNLSRKHKHFRKLAKVIADKKSFDIKFKTIFEHLSTLVNKKPKNMGCFDVFFLCKKN